MKLKRVILIGILTASAVALLGLLLKTNNRPKLQTKADYTQFVEYRNKNNWKISERIPNQNAINIGDGMRQPMYNGDITITRAKIGSSNTFSYQVTIYELFNADYDSCEVRTLNGTKFIPLNNKEVKAVNIQLNSNFYIIDEDEGDYGIAMFEIGTIFDDNTATWTDFSDIVLRYTDGTPMLENNIYTSYNQEQEILIDVETNINLLANTYTTGYNTSEAFNHPIAIQPLMLNILTMPFTFINKAFDVTLWPETQYAFNFANFIKGMLAIAAVLFIIRLFTSGFSIISNYTSNSQNKKLTKSKIQVNKATARRQNKLADKGK